jgi:hypothetical protein
LSFDTTASYRLEPLASSQGVLAVVEAAGEVVELGWRGATVRAAESAEQDLQPSRAIAYRVCGRHRDRCLPALALSAYSPD